MNYQTMKIDDIIKWCQVNNQVEWLKTEAAKTVPCKVYPRKKAINEDGKVVSVKDTSKEPVIENRPITFIQLKRAFVDEFMPEIAPKKSETTKPTMYDLIASL